MRRALDLKEDRGLDAGKIAVAGDVQRRVVADALKLYLLFQAVTRHIFLHFLDLLID